MILRFIRTSFIALSVLFFIFSFTFTALAAGSTGSWDDQTEEVSDNGVGTRQTDETASAESLELPDPLGGISIPVLIGNIIKTVAGVTGSIALVIFVWGGFEYIYSGGEQAKVKSATKRLTNASIGIILIYGAYFIASTAINFLLVTSN
jgi:hypothetical protein